MRCKASKFGRDQLVEFRWELAVGDDTLTEDEIAVLAETKAPVLRLRGQWVALDPDQLRRGLEFLERTPAGRKTAADILALAARPPDDIDTPLEVTAVAPTGGSGTCSAGPRHSRCGRWNRRTDSPRRCGPTSSAACRGWRSCPRSAWVAAWVTTWAWVTVQLLAVETLSDTGSRRRPHAAAVPDVIGRQLAAGGGEVRARPAGVRAPRRCAAARRRAG